MKVAQKIIGLAIVLVVNMAVVSCGYTSGPSPTPTDVAPTMTAEEAAYKTKVTDLRNRQRELMAEIDKLLDDAGSGYIDMYGSGFERDFWVSFNELERLADEAANLAPPAGWEDVKHELRLVYGQLALARTDLQIWFNNSEDLDALHDGLAYWVASEDYFKTTGEILASKLVGKLTQPPSAIVPAPAVEGDESEVIIDVPSLLGMSPDEMRALYEITPYEDLHPLEGYEDILPRGTLSEGYSDEENSFYIFYNESRESVGFQIYEGLQGRHLRVGDWKKIAQMLNLDLTQSPDLMNDYRAEWNRLSGLHIEMIRNISGEYVFAVIVVKLE